MLCHVQFFVTPWTAACQAPLSLGILQTIILEWVARPSSRGSSQPRDQNPSLPHCGWILYCLSHQESPRILEWVAYPFCRGSSWPRSQIGVSCIAGEFFTSWGNRKAMVMVIVTYGSKSFCMHSFIFSSQESYKVGFIFFNYSYLTYEGNEAQRE